MIKMGQKLKNLFGKPVGNFSKLAGAACLALLLAVGLVACNESDPPKGNEGVVTTAGNEFETTKPQETTKSPESTRPTDTIASATTTTSTATTASGTTTTSTTTSTSTTTTVITTTTVATTAPEATTPPTDDPGAGEEEEKNYDVPADEDGFAYSEWIGHKLVSLLTLGDTAEPLDDQDVSDFTPIVTFVEVGELKQISSSTYRSLVNIYAKFKIDETHYSYTKFVCGIDGNDYEYLNKAENFETYADFADAFAEAFTKAEDDGSWVLDIERFEVSRATDLDLMTEEQRAKLAPIIDERFVDVQVNFVDIQDHLDWGYANIINGFGYDAEGNSYSFETFIKPPAAKYGDWPNFLTAIKSETLNKESFTQLETESKRIDSVFISE